MPYLRTPGRGGGRRGPGGSGRVAPGPLPAPRRAEELGPQFPQFLYLGAVTHSHSASRPASPAFGVQAVRASCRLTQLRCWVVPGRDSSSSASSVRRVPSLHGKPSACLYLAAIPPHLRRGKPRRKCSGRPGGSPMGCWRRQCRNKSATDCAGAPASAVLASYFYSKVSASSRRPSYPAPTSVRRSQGGPFRPRPRRESAHPQRRSLSGSGSQRSPSPCTAKARRVPTLPDTLRGHAPLASLVPRPMALADSQPPHKAPAATLASVRLPAP